MVVPGRIVNMFFVSCICVIIKTEFASHGAATAEPVTAAGTSHITVNNPSNVKYVYQKMAEILNLDLQEFIHQVQNNVKRLFFKIKL